MHIEKDHTISAAADHAGIGVYLATAFLAGGFFFSYAGVFKALTGAWWDNSAYSHGFLVPVASLYIIWTERDRLKRLTPSTSYVAGFAILAIGIGMLLAGNAAGVMVIQELSIIVTLAGVALMVLGADFLKALWFPIAYLLFMLRFWDFIAARLHYPFQNFSAFLGTKLLNIIGIPAYRESIFIELPNITLKVADVCSGVNYLISVLALGVILAYLTLKGLTRSIILVCVGIVIATLANGVRVALIGTLSFYNLSGDLHGPYHALQAMFVAAAGFAALFAGAWALSNRREAAGPSQSAALRAAEKTHFQADSIKLPAIVAACLLIATGGYMNFHLPSPVEPRADLGTIPYEIGGWKGYDSPVEYRVFQTLGVDYEVSRTYRSGETDMKLYIGYYTLQKQDKELVNYKTLDLDSGARIDNIRLKDNGVMEVKRRIRKEEGNYSVISFWYDLNGRTAAGRSMSKAYTAYDSLFRGRTNGAIIIISGSGRDDETVIGKETEFIQALAPVLRGYLP